MSATFLYPFFMHGENVKTSAIPYGVNDAAGHYVKASDAHIYYEVYGTGKHCLVLHGVEWDRPMSMAAS